LEAIEQSIAVLESLGATARDVQLPPLQHYADAKKIIAMAELFTIHSSDLRERPHLLGESLRYLITCGGLISAEEYIQASRWRSELCRVTRECMAEFDILLLPTMSDASGKLEPIPDERFLTGERSYTTPFNVTGYPAISVCNGFNEAGMPLALQLVGHAFQEAMVLRVAHVYQSATDWHKKPPPLFQPSIDAAVLPMH
jgi:aspartyl-tRNA(Asn)/glutamyl-tRNA(Gln) amidotransferase subunit A